MFPVPAFTMILLRLIFNDIQWNGVLMLSMTCTHRINYLPSIAIRSSHYRTCHIHINVDISQIFHPVGIYYIK